MKLYILVLAGAAAALPQGAASDVTAVTDRLLFEAILPQFTAARNAKDPSNLDWSSDGCSFSPDNPFHFPFLQACQRHDFGYRNYEAQKRFIRDTRKKIDGNFHKDLYYQCEEVRAKFACNALADVYFGAVRLFGGLSKRDAAADAEYQKLVAIYEDEVRKAQAKGDLPLLQ